MRDSDPSKPQLWPGAVVGAGIGLVMALLLGAPIMGLVFLAVVGGLVGAAAADVRSAHLRFTARFVQQAWSKGTISAEARDALLDEIRREGVPIAVPVPAPVPAPVSKGVRAEPAAAPAAPEVPRPPTTEIPARPVVPAPPPVPAPAPPSPPSRPSWIDDLVSAGGRAWERLVSDFAVHGLTYLGVGLVFIATLGFVLFAFSELGAAWRPAGELAIPTVLFGAAAFLRKREAPFVASAVEALGGALTPVVAFAAFRDGAAIPPDLDGPALVVALTLVALGLAAVYRASVTRRPESTLRFLVAPLVWVAVGVVGLAFREEPSAAQMALVLAAIAVSAAALRRMTGTVAASSRIVVPYAAGLVYVLVLIFAGAEGWPLLPLLVAGVAAVGVTEAQPPVPHPWAVQAAVVAITAMAAAASIGAAPAGTGIVVVALALFELWAHRQAGFAASVTLLGLAAAGLALSVAEPWPMLVAFAVAAAWSHIRRLRRIDVVPFPVADGGAVVAPVLAMIGLGRVIGTEPALLVAGGVVLVATVLVRRYWHFDRFLVLALAGWAVLTLVGTLAPAPTATVAGAAALAAAAIALAPIALPARIWMLAATVPWVGFLAAEAAEVETSVRIVVAAAAALLAVGAGTTAGRDWTHLAAAGHAAAFAVLAAPASGWVQTFVIGALVAGWLIEVVAHEFDRSATVRLAASVGLGHPVAGLAVAIVILGIPATVTSGLDSGGITIEVWVVAAVATAAAVTYAGITRFVAERRPLGWLLAAGAVFTSIVGLAATNVEWLLGAEVVARRTGLMTLGGVVVAMALLDRRLRNLGHASYAWIATTPLVVLGALELGAPVRHIHWYLLGWGGLLGLGTLLADDRRHGRRGEDVLLRSVWSWPPLVVGVVTLVAGYLAALDMPLTQQWQAALVVTGITATGVYLIRLAPLSLIPYSAAIHTAWSVAAETAFDPIDRPWVLVIMAAVLAAVAFAVGRTANATELERRWEAPPLAVAALLIVAALALAWPAGSVDVTWAAAGALVVASGIVAHRLSLLTVGWALIVVAAAAAGSWWLVAALAVTSVGAGIVAVAFQELRLAAQWLSALAGGAAWAQAMYTSDLATADAVGLTAMVSGLVGLGWAGAIRILRRDLDWTATWAVPWVTIAALFGVAASGWGLEIGDPVSSWGATAGLAAWAATTGISAAPLALPSLPWVTAVVAAMASGAAGRALDASALVWVRGGVLLGIAAGVVAMVAGLRRPASPWPKPLLLYAGLLQTMALCAAIFLLPDRGQLILVLAVAGAEAIVLSVLLRSPAFGYAAPVLLMGSWLLFASEALSGSAQWFTAPIAVALLAIVDLARWDARRRGLDHALTPIVGADYFGMALLVAPALVEAVARNLWFAMLAAALGIVLALWGAATQVRRRVYAGGATVALAGLVLIAVPVARLIPAFRGVGLWIALFAVGAGLIGLATGIERGRRGLARIRSSLDELMADWE